MSVLTKRILFGIILAVAISWIGVIGVQAVVAKGSMQSAPGAVDPQGWMQIVIALIAALESGKGLWGTIGSVVQQVAPGISSTTIANGVNAAKIAQLIAYTGGLPPGPTKDAMNAAGRTACNEFRDQVFGVPKV